MRRRTNSILAAPSLVATLALMMLTAPPAAHAQDDSAADARARLHFDAGRSYYEEGDYEQAYEEFQRSYELSRRSLLLVNIANVQERLALWGEAADTLAQYLSESEDDPQRAMYEQRIAHLRARADRHQEDTTTTEAPAEPVVSQSETVLSNDSGARASEGLLIPSLVAFGVAGAALIAWATLGGFALAEESNVSNGCGATRSCTSSQVETMDDLALGSDVALGLGLAAIIAGTVLILVDPPHGADSRESAMVTPLVSATTLGLGIRGAL